MSYTFQSIVDSITASYLFFFNDTATTEIYTLSLHDALPISRFPDDQPDVVAALYDQRTDAAFFYDLVKNAASVLRSEEHTSELQSLRHLVCRLLLEKKQCSTANLPNTHRGYRRRVDASRSLI